MSAPTIYFIRHGEKDELPTDKDGNIIFSVKNSSNPTPNLATPVKKIDADGLNSDGEIRAQFLPQIFKKPKYNIQQIFTPDFDPAQATPQNKNHKLGDKTDDPWGNARPYQTVLPLVQYFKDQGHPVPHDHTIGVTKADDLVASIKNWIQNVYPTNKGNILVCWEHKNLTFIFESLFDIKHHDAPLYPDDRFDLILTCKPSQSGAVYTGITEIGYQDVTSWNSMYTAPLDANLPNPIVLLTKKD